MTMKNVIKGGRQWGVERGGSGEVRVRVRVQQQLGSKIDHPGFLHRILKPQNL